MAKKPTYKELEQRIHALEEEVIKLKTVGEELCENETRYRALFENTLDGVAVYEAIDNGEDFVFKDLNRSGERIENISKKDIIGKCVTEAFPGVKDFGIFKVFQRVWRTGKPEFFPEAGYKDDRDSGTWRENWVYKLANGEVVAVYDDITERKQAEKALRESEEQLRLVTDALPVLIAYVDSQKCYRFANKTYEEWFRISREDVFGKKVREVLGEPAYKLIQEYIDEALSGKKISFETILPYKDGRERYIRASFIPHIGEGGEVKGYYVLVIDNTKHKQADEALRESEEKFRAIFEQAAVGVAQVDTETGQFLRINTRYCEIIGYTIDEMAATTFKKITHPDDLQTDLDNIERLKAGKIREFILEKRYLHKDGSIVWVNLTVPPMWDIDEKPTYHIAVVEDITERKHLESQLQQTHKMEAIGTLSGGIAHDFNNILGIIVGNTEIAMMDVPDWNPARDNLERVRKACIRARDLVRQILAFSRQSIKELKPVRLGPIIKDSLKLLRSSIPTTIEIRQNISSESDTIKGDPTQINQILLNLCTNAAHAMREKGGLLEVSLEDVEINKESAARYHELAPGRYISLSISDTGGGIDPGIIDRIFDPYFTTKEVGDGTGMGLAVAHGIIKNHGGVISVESELGEGATFHVFLPCIGVEAEREFETIETLPKGNERILLVDDEKAMVDAVQPMLEHLGYKVTARTSSVEALEAFRNSPDTFDLIITDQTMPDMTGKDLATELIQIMPDIPIILCTGFSEMIDEDIAKEMGIKAFAMKPLVMSELAKTIREVLDES